MLSNGTAKHNMPINYPIKKDDTFIYLYMILETWINFHQLDSSFLSQD